MFIVKLWASLQIVLMVIALAMTIFYDDDDLAGKLFFFGIFNLILLVAISVVVLMFKM